MREPEEAGVIASRGRESPADRPAVILTPDQRVRVFGCSTLGEPAGTRNRCAPNPAACRSRRSWQTWPAIPRPGIWARPIRGVRGDELRTHGMPAMPQDLRRPSHMQGEPADSASGHIRRRRHRSGRWPAHAGRPVHRAWLHPTRRPNAASGQQTPRPRLVPALAGGVGRVFPCYTVSQVLAPCRPWQRPPRPAG